MNMFYNHSTISVDQLVEKGFVVEIHKDSFGGLKYGDAEAIVEYKLNGDKYYLGNIREWRGNKPLEVVKRLYQLFDIKLLDEDDCQECYCKVEEIYEDYFKKTFEKRFAVAENELSFDDEMIRKIAEEEANEKRSRSEYAEFFVKNNS